MGVFIGERVTSASVSAKTLSREHFRSVLWGVFITTRVSSHGLSPVTYIVCVLLTSLTSSEHGEMTFDDPDLNEILIWEQIRSSGFLKMYFGIEGYMHIRHSC